jgi:hypothetical protein
MIIKFYDTRNHPHMGDLQIYITFTKGKEQAIPRNARIVKEEIGVVNCVCHL